MSIRKHKPKKCDSVQMVRDRCESRGQAVNEVMRKFCEDVERRKAERDADELARAMVRLADELGANV